MLILTVEFFILQFFAQAGYDGYSLVDMDISLLGVTGCDAVVTVYDCSPRHLAFNLGMIVNGLLILGGAWLTRRAWPPGPLTTAALWLLAVGSGLGALLIGLFPVDIYMEGHLAGAVLTLFVACLGILAMGSITWRSDRLFSIYSIATAAVSLLASGLYLLELYFGIGRGTMERIAAWSHTVWYMATGLMILRGWISAGAGHRPQEGERLA